MAMLLIFGIAVAGVAQQGHLSCGSLTEPQAGTVSKFGAEGPNETGQSYPESRRYPRPVGLRATESPTTSRVVFGAVAKTLGR
jgi:hypothetical protein